MFRIIRHMKKPKSNDKFPNKSLKNLREILGMSQERFAAEIGVSPDSIDSIEIGRMALTPKMARRITVATGAQLGTTKYVWPSMRASWHPFTDGTVRSGWRNKEHPSNAYTIETFKYHQTKFQTSPKAAEEQLAEIVEQGLRPLFIAASKPSKGAKYRLPALVLELEDWIQEAEAKFKLSAA